MPSALISSTDFRGLEKGKRGRRHTRIINREDRGWNPIKSAFKRLELCHIRWSKSFEVNVISFNIMNRFLRMEQREERRKDEDIPPLLVGGEVFSTVH